MTRHRVFVFRGAASFLAAAIVLFTSSGCDKDSSAGCDGATRGCVQLVNITTSDRTVSVIGGGSAVAPAGTPSAPGYAWITVVSTVGAEVTFTITQFNPGIATCVVDSSTWSDPSTPPQVYVYTVSGLPALNCYNW